MINVSQGMTDIAGEEVTVSRFDMFSCGKRSCAYVPDNLKQFVQRRAVPKCNVVDVVEGLSILGITNTCNNNR